MANTEVSGNADRRRAPHGQPRVTRRRRAPARSATCGTAAPACSRRRRPTTSASPTCSRRERRSPPTRRRRCSKWPAGRSSRRPPARRGRTRRSASTRTLREAAPVAGRPRRRGPAPRSPGGAPAGARAQRRGRGVAAPSRAARPPSSTAATASAFRTCGSSAARSVWPSTARSAGPATAEGPRRGRRRREPEHPHARHAADRRHAERERDPDGHTRGAARGRARSRSRTVPSASSSTSRSRARSRTPSTACGSTRSCRRRPTRGSRRRGSCRRRCSSQPDPAEAAAVSADEHIAPRPGEELDVAITSSALSLGLIQAFVPQVTKVSGTLQADVRVTGSPRDPHLSGCDRHPQRGVHRRRSDERRVHGSRHAYHARARSRAARSSSACSTSTAHAQRLGRARGAPAPDRRRADRDQVGSVRDHRQQARRHQVEQRPARSQASCGSRASRALSACTPAPSTSGRCSRWPRTTRTQWSRRSSRPRRPAAPPPATAASGAAAATPAPAAGRSQRSRGVHGRKPGCRRGTPASAEQPAPGQRLRRAGARRPALDAEQPRGQGHGFQSIGCFAGQPRRRQRHARRRRAGDQEAGRQGAAARHGQHRARQLRLPGPPLRHPARRPDPVRGPHGDQPAARHRGAAADLGRRGAGARARHARSSRSSTLTSTPPLDEADILSLIIFNQPVNALGEGQQVSLAQRAGALASGFVASSLAKSIGSALELDVFEIQTAPEDGTGPSVTLGEQVGERLFLKFRQAFGAQSVSELHSRVPAHELPAPADVRRRGRRRHPAHPVPARRSRAGSI